ncbi:MAG TPA: FecR family protein [Elusimicrobiales bacterium]|nr:FecR family protein [Elusimicrobiales bacterium]
MKTMSVVMAAAMFLFLSPGVSAGELSAIAVYAKGKVELRRAGDKEFRKLKVNDMIYTGDTIKTGRRSRASLVMKGGAEVRLNQSSEFEIESTGQVREVLKLSVGQLWSRMLHKMAKINVRTPSAVCAVRGTEADIEQRSLLTVKVYEGHVDVQNAAGLTSLKAGQMSTVKGADSAPAAASEMGKGDAGTWQDGIKVKNMDDFVKRLMAAAESGKSFEGRIKTKDGEVKEIKVEGLQKK